MSDPRLQRLSTVENTVMGCATGAIDVTLTQWMLYSKNLSQQKLGYQNMNLMKCFTTSPLTMYRGYTMSLIDVTVLTGLQFPLTAAATAVITGGAVRRLSDAEMVAAAFVGGAFSGVVCAPMELVMIQQQNFGTSLLATPAAVVERAGGSALFRGLAMSCGREGVFTAGMLGLGPTVKRYAKEVWGCGEALATVAGAVGGGVIVATLSHPMDTIKTCQQGDVCRATYGGVLETAKTLLDQNGPRRFFSGWAWRTSRMVVQCFLFDQCKTRLSPIFFPHHFHD